MITPQKIFSSANTPLGQCLFCHPNNGMSLCETENYRVLRCNFPAALGHIMISSKEHYGCLGELDAHLIPELQSLQKSLSEWYALQGKKVIYYEHGRAGSCHSKGEYNLQCEHFHLNSIAGDVCIHEQLEKYYGEGIHVQSNANIPELFQDWGEYLFFENNHGNARYYPVTGKQVPSHLLRTLLCNALNLSEKANWEEHQSYEDFLQNYHFTHSISEHIRSSQHAIS